MHSFDIELELTSAYPMTALARAYEDRKRSQKVAEIRRLIFEAVRRPSLPKSHMLSDAWT